jgi:hypothetical protein
MWFVYTLRDGLIVCVETYTGAAEALDAAGLDPFRSAGHTSKLAPSGDNGVTLDSRSDQRRDQTDLMDGRDPA